MKQVSTELTVQKVNKRMKKKGFSSRKSTMSPFCRIYTKGDIRLMYVFERKIRTAQMRGAYC